MRWTETLILIGRAEQTRTDPLPIMQKRYSSQYAKVDRKWASDSKFLRLSHAHICRDCFRQDSRAALLGSAAQCLHVEVPGG